MLWQSEQINTGANNTIENTPNATCREVVGDTTCIKPEYAPGKMELSETKNIFRNLNVISKLKYSMVELIILRKSPRAKSKMKEEKILRIRLEIYRVK